jgi:polysaccharide deacetylase family protein (PEP-CTERM system associated)
MTSPALITPEGAGLVAIPQRRHILTIAVEDYFQTSAFRSLITASHWYRFEPRIERNTLRTLDLLDEYGVKATFFTLGWVADEMPSVVKEIARRGHEVASKGYFHRTIQEMSTQEFRDDLRRSRIAIEDATGAEVIGYRAARGHIGVKDLWALDILAEEGFTYDSSFYPRYRSVAREPWRRFAFVHQHQRNSSLHVNEFPLATGGWMGLHVPIAGGAYLRHIPHKLISRALRRRAHENPSPLVMYFHVWELDDDLPRITAAASTVQLRQYRNLHKMESRVRYYIERYAFDSVRDHLRLLPQPAPERVREIQAPLLTSAPSERVQVTLVAPCFNEGQVLPSLAPTLQRLEADLAAWYEFRFVFVDDGSSDDTWAQLQRLFAGKAQYRLVKHERNRGVAAAILTGIANAETEIVCSIDCDCTYDPHQIADLLPLLTEDVAVVTASPYHPDGVVKNVPAWRLVLSKSLSMIYRRLFRLKLYTYTSCFRAYRRSRMQQVQVTEGGFLGVAEMLLQLDRQGARVIERAAVLEVRLLGHSKMKVLRTIRGHLGLIGRMMVQRLRSRLGGPPPLTPTAPPG